MTTSPRRITESHIITSSNRHAHVLSRARTPIWTQCWKPCSDGLMPWMRHGWRVDGLTARWPHVSTASRQHGFPRSRCFNHLRSWRFAWLSHWPPGTESMANQRDDDRKMHDDKWTKWRKVRNQWGIRSFLVIWIPSNLPSGSWGWRPRSYRSCDLSIREWQSREHILSIPVSLVVPTVIRLQFCSSWTFMALWHLSQIASMVSRAKFAKRNILWFSHSHTFHRHYINIRNAPFPPLPAIAVPAP